MVDLSISEAFPWIFFSDAVRQHPFFLLLSYLAILQFLFRTGTGVLGKWYTAHDSHIYRRLGTLFKHGL